MPRDRSGARTIEPEFLASIGIDGDEAFARARIRKTHDFGRRTRHRVLVVADDIADQHHLRQYRALGLGRVADRAQITLVEMFEAGKLHAGSLRFVIEEILDLDDRGNRMARVTEELHADGARVLGHAMQHPASGSDQTVAAFLLHARQAAQKFVRDVLAQADLAKLAAFDVDA